jgi:hypothetical protein
MIDLSSNVHRSGNQEIFVPAVAAVGAATQRERRAKMIEQSSLAFIAIPGCKDKEIPALPSRKIPVAS